MARKHPILKGLGLLTGFVLVVFAVVFFYAYLTGGDAKALSRLAGDGVGILQFLDQRVGIDRGTWRRSLPALRHLRFPAGHDPGDPSR